MTTRDFIVVGAGSAGSVAAAKLAEQGSVLVLEAGRDNVHPLVRIPFGLVGMMGRKARDWCFQSTPQAGLNGRLINVPRGKMVGGSGSINSMVWFRGQPSDFDDWNIPGWGWSDVAPHFEAVEDQINPSWQKDPHPLTQSLNDVLAPQGVQISPTPEVEGFGQFLFNMRPGRRHSATDAFLKAPRNQGRVFVQTHTGVDRLILDGTKAIGVLDTNGQAYYARRGVILCAGSLASPPILMRSGIGPAAHLRDLGTTPILDQPAIGANLHDHPGVGFHFRGRGSGYGLTLSNALAWAFAPLNVLRGRGPFASPTVEGGGFFNARNDGGRPDVQTHVIPFPLPFPNGPRKSQDGFFADVCLCRPKSRGALHLASADPNVSPLIDLGLFGDESDLDTMVAGAKRLRSLMAAAGREHPTATEVYPGPTVTLDDDLRDYIRQHAGTAYHPVGTAALGTAVNPDLGVKGTHNLWVADASVMPQVTSANTNAPSMMIGHRVATFIQQKG